MTEDNISQKFRLKNIGEARNYLTEDINQSDLMCKKNKKICTVLNFINHFLILASAVTGLFFSCYPIGTTSCAVELKISAIILGIKKYMLIKK